MKGRFLAAFVVVGFLLVIAAESKKIDPYKVLGVDSKASQRDIQKAFHKLSLKYHPDKNKNKGAQEKFAEINNAYDILSDEEKRKNYDLYGDEKGNPGFNAGDPRDQGGYSYFTSGGPGQGGFSSGPGGWQHMGGQGGSKSFSFSFGGPSSGNQDSFGFGDIFSNLFGGGMGGGNQFGGGMGGGNKFGGGFGSSGRPPHGKTKGPAMSIPSINTRVYKKEVADKGMAWLLLFHTPNLQGTPSYESVLSEAYTSLHGALKAGSVNCESDASLCKELGVHPRRAPKIFVYSYASSEKGSLVEYNGDLSAKPLKTFCEDHLPRFSKRVNLDDFDFNFEASKLPKVLLLSSKKNTPAIWRVLSGLYHKRIVFYDAKINDMSDPSVRKLGVDGLPAIVGWLSNGEKQVLKSGISVKDLKSAIQELSGLLDSFEKRSKKAAPVEKDNPDSRNKDIPLLMASNFNDVCSEKVPVCVIGAFRSSRQRDSLQAILQSMSQKSFSRQQNAASVSYALLDASKQQAFLKALDRSGFKSSENLLIAYKPKRGTYAVFQGEVTHEAVERFIGSVLNGDLQFSKTRQKPTLK